MNKTIFEVIKTDFKAWLTEYIDLHRYEIIFTVTIATGNNYTEKNFKSFRAACHCFNKNCINHGATDSVIW